jgi:hypothetical protein
MAPLVGRLPGASGLGPNPEDRCAKVERLPALRIV